MAIKNEVEAQKYSKDQLISSNRFQSRRDILNALLVDGKMYSLEETEQLVDKFMKGKVK